MDSASISSEKRYRLSILLLWKWEKETEKLANNEIITKVWYENVVSVLNHCDNSLLFRSAVNKVIHVNLIHVNESKVVLSRSRRRLKRSWADKISLNEFHVYKSGHSYRSCRNSGHFESSCSVGVFKHRIESFSPLLQNSCAIGDYWKAKHVDRRGSVKNDKVRSCKTATINEVNVTHLQRIHCTVGLRLVVNDGAPYTAAAEIELKNMWSCCCEVQE